MKEPVPRLLAVSHLEGWEGQWDGLVDQAPLPSPFLRSWWLTSTAGPQRRFLLAVDGEQLMGGLALDERGWPGLQILHMMGSGHLCPDHMDLITAPGQKDLTISLLRTWFQRPGGRLLDLMGVPGNSRVVEALPIPVSRVRFAVAPWTPLPDDAKVYFAGLPSQLRRNIRRASTRLTAEGANHRSRRGPSAVEALKTLRTMHEAQWGDRSRFLSEFDRFAAACRLGAGADEVVVHELANDETVIATVVSFEVAGRVSLYQSARLTESRWRNAMSVLLNAVISDACDRGFSEVDFLRGEEPYKDGFAPRRRELFRLLAARGAAGRTARRTKSAASTTRRMAEDSVRAGLTAFGRGRPER
ncbi:MAG: GNAT family N-acetyltransferase [Acidimicrobiales bacterium]|nr:GNAT family N-acetyltransferase [Acidimicrobiales bacterium]